MKKFAIITLALVIVLTPSFSFAGAIEWVNGTTYISGHDVTGTMTNGIALLCMLAPLLVAITYTAYVMIPFRKIFLKRA